MKRLIRIGLGGLLGGVIVHVLAILWLPGLAARDAWAAFGAFVPDGRFHLLVAAPAGTAEHPGHDPGFAQAICRFHLGDGPVRVTAAIDAEFWSAAIFDRRGDNIYSLNDRTAGRAPLDLLLADAKDLAALQQREAPILDDAVVVDVADPEGIVVLRVFLSDSTMRAGAEAMLTAAACAPLSAPAGTPGG